MGSDPSWEVTKVRSVRFRGTNRGASVASRRVARLCLGLMAGFLALMVMVGPSFGSGIVLAQATTSPSASPSGPQGPTIQLLNPSLAYDQLEEGTVQMSDKFDGVDQR